MFSYFIRTMYSIAYFLSQALDNNIEEINGLSYCYCLKKLSLAHNNIQHISGLSNLPLTQLNLVSVCTKFDYVTIISPE